MIKDIARAAETLPDLPFNKASKLNHTMLKQMKQANRAVPNTYDAADMERFASLGQLFKAAARFKQAANKLAALGPVSPRLGVGVRAEDLEDGTGLPDDFEEEISPRDDWPEGA
jgi:hypothetical protein